MALDGYQEPRNTIREIKSRRMKRAEHVARVGRGEVHTGFWWGNTKERAHLEDPGIDGKILLNWIFKKWDGTLTGLIWLRKGTDGGLL